MIIQVFPVGMLGVNCVILGDEDSKEAVVIDPGGDTPEILVRLSKAELRVAAIVHTHGHVDHVGGTGELKRVTGAPVYVHEADRLLFEKAPEQAMMFGLPTPEMCAIDHDLPEGARVEVGTLALTAIHTPGHSPGSVSLLIDNLCFCGDTLFAGGIGRTDIWGGSYDTLEQSIRDRLYTLDPATEVIPGHGPPTTIETERLHNPFVRA
jgi:hydroxyacylglutathione hydrolase